MCGSSAPPAPKESPQIAKAANAQAKLGREALDFAKGQAKSQEQLGREHLDFAKSQAASMEALGRDYLNFAKDQFKVSQERQVDIDARAKEIATFFTDIAKGDRERYETVFKPLEDDYIKTAQEFDSPERLEQAASEAKADVQSAAAVQKGARERDMASLGINPASGRYQGIERAGDLGTAATSVDAQNRARIERRNTAIGLRRDAIGLGRDTNAAAMNAGGAALNPTFAANQSFLASQGIVAPGYGAAATGLGQGASTVAGGYGGAAAGLGQGASTGLSGYGAAQQGAAGQAQTHTDLFRNKVGLWGAQSELDAANASGIGSALGTAAGIGLSFVSDEKAKKNRKKVPEGEALAAVEGLGIEGYSYKEGVADGGAEPHVGPMAQDFSEATGKGDGKRIAYQDAIGIALGAIKDLNAKVDRVVEAIGLGSQPQHA